MALSIPDFLWGLIFILLFGVVMPLFAISGRISPSIDLDFLTQFYLIEAVVRLRFDVIGNLINHMIEMLEGLVDSLGARAAQTLALQDEMIRTLRVLQGCRGCKNMPGGMSGYDLVEAARKIRPRLKVLLTSGYAEDLLNADRLTDLEARLLRKPYRQTDLAAAIRRALGPAGG